MSVTKKDCALLPLLQSVTRAAGCMALSTAAKTGFVTQIGIFSTTIDHQYEWNVNV